ncbi:putative gustatory receptor 59b [Teleopsis dalmanni]|uniref:putative gustatory receptor 59b n=1 Tax=Teleopsis dalmanni TaxID=139649 RepID=UPI0018CE910C|nr:putative gustatory receptor 59b [Teleopsis dalmanni]
MPYWEHSFVNSLFWIYHYYAVCIGMSSHRYDYATNKYKQSLMMRVSVIIVNALTVLVLPWVLWECTNIFISDEWTLLITWTFYVNIIIHGLAIIYTVINRYRRELALCGISIEMMNIELNHLKDFPINHKIEAHYNTLFCIKYAFLVYTFVAHTVTLFYLMKKWTWYTILLTLLFSNVDNVLHTTMFTYFVGIWYICRGISYINDELKNLLNKYTDEEYKHHQYRKSVAKKLHYLLCLHCRLVRLIRLLNDAYSIQMLAIRITRFFTNVMIGFYAIVLFENSSITSFWILFGIITYLVIEHFVLQLFGNKLEIDLCGLFHVNKGLWFQMMTAVISYTIVLVQFHLFLSQKTK